MSATYIKLAEMTAMTGEDDVRRIVFAGDLGDLAWQQARSLSDGALAFQALAEQKVAVPKIMLVP